jgi:hypothetical protein
MSALGAGLPIFMNFMNMGQRSFFRHPEKKRYTIASASLGRKKSRE